jgi:hypothetical protein
LAKVRLDSWKAIAQYLDRGPRTVQRWHAEHGLPVHHFGGTQGCVFAYAEELDNWLSGVGAGPGLAIANGGGAEAARSESSGPTAQADEMWATRSEWNISSIAGLYRGVLNADPGNVRALTGLACTMVSSAIFEVVDSSVAFACATDSLRRVPIQGSQYSDAHCCGAFLKMLCERKWRQARIAFEELLREQPSHPFGLKGRALLHVADSELQDASSCAWKAWLQSPLASSAQILICWIEFLAGDYNSALDLVAQFTASGSSGSMIATIQALALSQNAPDASRIGHIAALVDDFPENRTLRGILGYAYANSGETERACQVLKVLQEMCERKKKNCSYALALPLIGLNRKQEAISWLETSYEQGAIWSLGFRSDPILKPLRGEPRFEALLRNIGSQPELFAIDQARYRPEAMRFGPKGVSVEDMERSEAVS